MKRFCLAPGLKNALLRFKEYEQYYQKTWPEKETSVRQTDSTAVEMYRGENSLFTTANTKDAFAFEVKFVKDKSNEK
jgi:hypothetical protein